MHPYSQMPEVRTVRSTFGFNQEISIVIFVPTAVPHLKTCIRCKNVFFFMDLLHRTRSLFLIACSMIFAPGPAASASAWVPLLYDTVVLLLTTYRIVPVVRKYKSNHILQTMLRDGLLYYRCAQHLSTRL